MGEKIKKYFKLLREIQNNNKGYIKLKNPTVSKNKEIFEELQLLGYIKKDTIWHNNTKQVEQIYRLTDKGLKYFNNLKKIYTPKKLKEKKFSHFDIFRRFIY
jgi:DNA-binding PadR family transcriptional regulator